MEKPDTSFISYMYIHAYMHAYIMKYLFSLTLGWRTYAEVSLGSAKMPRQGSGGIKDAPWTGIQLLKAELELQKLLVRTSQDWFFIEMWNSMK